MTMTDLFRASGPVGALQASGPLKRLGRRFGFAFGPAGDPAAIRPIAAFCRAARVARALRRVAIGVLPYRCDQMTGTYVDEFRLRKELGPELKYLSILDYKTFCDEVAPARVEQFLHELRARYPLSASVTAAGLERAARASLGLAGLVERHHLDALALEDVNEELHRLVGLRPCLAVPELSARAVVSMEADVSAAAGLWILRELTGQAPMYTEIFTCDLRENALLMGHAGMHDAPRLVESPADILIEPDGEYAESEPDSAWMRFRARGGPVTLLSIFCDVERFKLVIARGEAVGGPPRLLGSPHIYVKIKPPLADFFEQAIRTGMTQHWAVVHAEVVDELQALAGILGLDEVTIE
jgi:L-arabinose isomerase